MDSQILIEGDGLLADYVQRHLSGKFTLLRKKKPSEVPQNIKLALVLHDAWNPSAHHLAEQKFRAANVPWLRGFTRLGKGIIGPLVLPAQTGCSCCADMRLITADFEREETWRIQNKLAVEGGMQRDVWTSHAGYSHITHLIVSEAERILQGKHTCSGVRMFLTDLTDLTVSSHIIIPEPHCPVCSKLPVDSSELAEINLQSSPKINGGSYRCRSLNDLKSGLKRDYLDSYIGILNGKMQDSKLPFADVVVNLPMFGGDEGAAGRSINYESSEIIAVLEGLERYCGIEPRGKQKSVRDSFDNLKNIALDPNRVGLHEDEQYEKPNFPFKPFHPKTPMNWVWGYSLLQNRSILIPERLAYYSLGNGEGFVYETSNGCALGGSIEEAIFHGILEVVERDSFLLTWYGRLALPKLDPYSATDNELLLMVERLRETAGYDLHLFNSTMEHGIPSIWAIAKNKNTKGLNLICAAGASLDPVNAAKSAIYELAGMMRYHDGKLEGNREKYQRMLTDPYEVRTMEDHGLLYGLPEAEERLNFLLEESRPRRTFAEEYHSMPGNIDLKDDVEELLHRLRNVDLEVIVIDQSSPVTKRNGLYCVKVLIPGMLPMTFGHHLARLKGLDRVLNVPRQLGFTQESLTYEQLNPFPHPFP